MKYTTKMLAMLLVLVMTVSVMAPAFAAETVAAPSILDEITAAESEAAYADDEYVSVIVELASAAVMEESADEE